MRGMCGEGHVCRVLGGTEVGVGQVSLPWEVGFLVGLMGDLSLQGGVAVGQMEMEQ